MVWAVLLLLLVPFLLSPPAVAAPEEATPEALAAQVSAERIERSVRTLAEFGTRHTASDTTSEVRGIGAARRWIEARLREAAEGTGARVEVRPFTAPPGPRLQAAVEVQNLLLVVPGSDESCRARTTVVTAHYDTRATDVRDAVSDAPGANDDGSGCAVVLELAFLLASRPRRSTVVLGLVGAEEQGLLGSRALALGLKEAGVRVEGMVTNDIVGNTKGPDGSRHRDSIRVFSEGLPRGESDIVRQTRIDVGGENDGPSRQLARFAREAQRAHLPELRVDLVFRPDRFLRGGDHLPFNEAGFAAIRFTEPVEDFDRQHQDVRREGDREYGDLADAVDFEYVAEVARLNLVFVSSLADGPGAPQRPRIRTASLEHGTTLTWDAVEEAGVAGYEVVTRSTLAPDWERAIPVGKVLEAKLPISKDETQFGVRTVDEKGRRSVVAWPFPVR